MAILVSFRADVRLKEQNGDVSLESDFGVLPLGTLDPGVSAAFRRLSAGGVTEQELVDVVVARDGIGKLPYLFFFLDRLANFQQLVYVVVADEITVATITPISSHFKLRPVSILPDARLTLSRFAVCRRRGDELILESPRSHARVNLCSPLSIQLVGALAQQRTFSELAVPDFLSALVAMNLVRQMTTEGRIDEDEDPVLAQWDATDLLFHTRSRLGRHDNPLGGNFRFLEKLAPLPALKPPMSAERVALHTPDLAAIARKDPSFTSVLERRRSTRAHGDSPMTAQQLGEFLYRCARVRELRAAAPMAQAPYETSSRPYPSGGATYDLEMYLSINRCDGLESGLYHYEPGGHQLERLSGRTPQVEALLSGASIASGGAPAPQILITLASRFQRLGWKYDAIAYATTLKNVGVLYQTMYLVATAMGLAACGLGSGDADLFAQAAGTDYYAETSVGEFMIGTPADMP